MLLLLLMAMLLMLVLRLVLLLLVLLLRLLLRRMQALMLVLVQVLVQVQVQVQRLVLLQRAQSADTEYTADVYTDAKSVTDTDTDTITDVYIDDTAPTYADGDDGTAPTLAWNVSVQAKGKTLLHQVFGYAKPGRIHAILGPSGSGKTTLLNTLAGEVSQYRDLDIKGSVLTAGFFRPVYITQEDVLFAQLSTRETLETSLRLSHSGGGGGGGSGGGGGGGGRIDPVQTRVTDMLNALSLTKVQSTRVGDSKTRGLSGGEKKRLCIGNEVIDSLCVSSRDLGNSKGDAGNSKGDSGNGGDMGNKGVPYIFADEPTSGLDCFQAQKAIALLRRLAQGTGSDSETSETSNSGISSARSDVSKSDTCAVVFSIHQPRASIYDMFDDISLLSEGRVLYSGPANLMVPHFSSLGYPLPPGLSPSEYYVGGEVGRLRRGAQLQASASTSISPSTPVSTSTSTSISVSASAPVSKSPRGGLGRVVGVAGWPLRVVGRGLGGLGQGLGRGVRGAGGGLRRFGILNGRAWRQVTRDRSLNIARFTSSLFSALLFGAIYFNLGMGVGTIPDRLGLLQ
ncbi:P-loop containing nucleoside triphosphate hydrolase protein, partial [Ochromonadaceae sp. CCMP2298]